MAIGNHYSSDKKLNPKVEMSRKKVLRKGKRKILKLDKYNAYNDG